MIFSRVKITAFLALMLVTGWLLYPTEYMRGRMYRDHGDRTESVRLFRSFLRRRPGHKGATMGLVAALEAAGRPDEAVQPLLDFYRLRRGDLESGQAAIGLMERVQRPGDADDFRWELIEDMRLLPPPGRKRIEQVLFEALQRAVAAQDDERALKALSILAAHSPEGASFRDQMVRLLLSRGLLERALAVLREELRAAPKNADLLRVIVRIHRAMGNAGAALGDIATGLGHVPDHVGLLADRADMMMEAKRWTDAEADFRTLMRLEPAEEAWPHELARCFLEGGRFADGIAQLEAIRDRDPADPKRWWAIVYAYTDRGMNAEAVPALERLRARFPDDLHALDALVYTHQQLGRNGLAVRLLEARARRAPGDLERRKTLIWLLVDDERLNDAAAHVEAIIARAPGDAQAWLQGAYLRETVGDTAGAIALYERYLKLFPEDDKSLEKLAGLYAASGRRKDAIDVLKAWFEQTEEVEEP
jgi:tetratricopeptide (TPR) repeat protein